MTTQSQFLPVALQLHDNLTAKIELQPMPEPDDKGRYPLRQDCEIHLTFLRDDQLIERRAWHTVISAEQSVTLADGTVLDQDDLHVIDTSGWDQMMDYGLIPGTWVG